MKSTNHHFLMTLLTGSTVKAKLTPCIPSTACRWQTAAALRGSTLAHFTPLMCSGLFLLSPYSSGIFREVKAAEMVDVSQTEAPLHSLKYDVLGWKIDQVNVLISLFKGLIFTNTVVSLQNRRCREITRH